MCRIIIIVADQDQTIKTKHYRNKILKMVQTQYGQFQETIDQIVAGCTELANTEYLQRHNKTATYLQWNICKEMNYRHTREIRAWAPNSNRKRQKITILWDMPIQRDRVIEANRPDVVIKNKQEKSRLLIDISIPTEKNTSVKVTEKFSKYKDLEIKVERMWGMKATTIPVVIGALELIKKGLEEYI